ncbi:MAG TPA: hypothetical protein DCQ88_00685, partial [Acidimicrobiaceae bacterium]|nr:hypothetical protein [Acidimicrobiaceae bacterium]
MFKENLKGFLTYIPEELHQDKFFLDVSLSDLSTYKVGGRAALYLKVEDSSIFSKVIEGLQKFPLPVLLLGNGSNVLISDEGFDGLVLKLGDSFESIEIDGTIVKAGAAAKLPLVARQTVKFGLKGFEWAVGVPGTIGGAVKMNAGGHGSDMAASLLEVTTLNLLTGLLINVPVSQLEMSYRHSCIKNADLVLAATLKLHEGDKYESNNLLKEIVRWRR